MSNGKLQVLPSMIEKFDGTPQEEEWRAIMAAHTVKYGIPTAAGPAASASRTPSAAVRAGPDFSCADLPTPKVINVSVVLEATPLEVFDQLPGSHWRGRCPAKRLNAPGLLCSTAGDLYLHLPPGLTNVEVSAMELAGFHTGVWDRIDVGKVPAGVVPWIIESDAQLVCLTNPGEEKRLMTLAACMHEAFAVHGLPSVLLDSHIISPIENAHFRFAVAPAADGATRAFKPDELAMADTNAHLAMKHGSFGSVLLGLVKGQPPNPSTVGVVWEIKLEKSPPATLMPVKPKLFLLSAFAADSSKAYRLRY
jgi:hypothetical protein